MILTLEEIAKLIDAKVYGESSKKIIGINTLVDATSDQISYAVSQKYKKLLISSNAGAIIMDKKLIDHCPSNALLVENVYLAYAILTHEFKNHQNINHFQTSSQIINSYSKVNIAPGCIIGKNVTVGENTSIGANCIIEDDVTIGKNLLIESNVTIHKGCVIGKKCVISSGAIIGSEGFGNARDKNNKWHAIAHLGNVIIGDDVFIGANTTIDRGSIGNTEIHNGVKIDNLVHIAHNVIIGEDTAIAATTGIAGSTVIGKRCMIGGMVGIVDHLTITDDVIVNATSTVNRNITKPGVYTGFVPLMLHSEWKKVGVWLTKLDKIATLLKIKLKNIK
jgi:UDP-3-O-[3-hydroxymyristoyl] glucosamine N-acyltransferase